MSTFTHTLWPAQGLPVLMTVLGGALLLSALHLSFRSIRNKHLPPGPPTNLLTGTRDLPGAHAWLKYDEWCKQYGELFTLWVSATKPVVVIGGYAAAQAILEKQSNVTSSRPFVSCILAFD